MKDLVQRHDLPLLGHSALPLAVAHLFSYVNSLSFSILLIGRWS